MVRHGTFAYTWDVVGDPAAAGRIAELGVDTVTLQAAYHSVRAITPLHPAHRIIHADYAAAYFRLRPERWRARLKPPAPAWGVEDDDRFGTAATALSRAGLRVEAWLVLAHSSRLGAAFPDLTVRNAFGESYPYALCPARPEVRDYCLGLVAEVCEQYDTVDALMLEACGWLGYEHFSPHDKTSGADLSQSARTLLSICLCPACRRAQAKRGMDGEELARDVRAAIERELRDGVTADLVLGEEQARILYDHRTTVITELVTRAAELGGGREVLLMAADDPLATGPDVGVDLARFPGPADTFVVKAWREDEDAAIAAVKSAIQRTAKPVVANVTVLGERPKATAARVGRLLNAGAAGIRYYHAGLASMPRLTALREAVQLEEQS
ncbi:hypothetical protein AB0K16_54455 [Nonomuraea jabiensis]|uniref:hypothetical protein n=1 Tax=Nonomuraea jabiensis TaxID=882448 RepID=UPI00343F27A8